MDKRNRGLLGRTSQNAKVPNSHQSFGEDMQGESADKLQIIQTHLQLLGSLTVVFVAESGFVAVDANYPVVGDCYLVRVSAQVFQHSFGMAKGPLRIDHPLFLEELIDQFLFRFDPGLKRFHILGPKHFAHRLDREQVLALGFGCSPLPFLSQSTSRHDAVQMGMKGYLLSPGMENGNHPGFGSQMLRIFGKATDRLPCRFKQAVIDGLGLMHGQLIQRVGQRKHHVKVGHGKQLGLPVRQPLFPVLALALRAMSVPAAVVTDPYRPAFGAGIHMAAQVGSPATLQR